jgi:5'-3' exonuclease
VIPLHDFQVSGNMFDFVCNCKVTPPSLFCDKLEEKLLYYISVNMAIEVYVTVH